MQNAYFSKNIILNLAVNLEFLDFDHDGIWIHIHILWYKDLKEP